MAKVALHTYFERGRNIYLGRCVNGSTRRIIEHPFPKFRSGKQLQAYRSAYVDFMEQNPEIPTSHHRAVLEMLDTLDFDLFLGL